MKKFVAFVVAIGLFVMLLLGAADLSKAEATDSIAVPANPITVPKVTETVVKEVVKVVPGPTVTVPGPTITVPGATVTVPGPTVTIPGPTVTVTKLPQPGATVTAPPRPGPTSTVTMHRSGRMSVSERPGPTQTVTVTANPPGTGVTRPPAPLFVGPTPAATPTRQVTPDRGKVDDDSGGLSFDIDLGDDDLTAGEVGIGLLTLLGLVGLLLLAMYSGYVLGYKDSEKADTTFMRAVLDEAKIRRGKHS